MEERRVVRGVMAVTEERATVSAPISISPSY